MLHLYLIMVVDRQKEEEFNFNINERINMIKKEENKEENNNDLKKPEPFAHKNWTELIKPTKIDVSKKEEQETKKKNKKLFSWLS